VTASAPDLAERYGAPSRSRRPLVIVVAVSLVACGLAWLVWATVFHGRPQVTSELVGFDIDGQHSATARFTVVRHDDEVSASCLLRAFADDHSVVGEVTVPVSTGAAAATLTSRMRTERRATTVDLVGCTAAGQKQPR
jgi:hypothetical protein